MQLTVSCQDEELLECKSDVDQSIESWVADKEHFEMLESDVLAGLRIQVKKAEQLKVPLNFLYGLAKEYKLEFAISQLDEERAEWEEVCYFGNEEGRPDIFEVACYLGL